MLETLCTEAMPTVPQWALKPYGPNTGNYRPNQVKKHYCLR